MQQVRIVGELSDFGPHHKYGTLELADGTRVQVMQVKKPRFREKVAVNQSKLDEALSFAEAMFVITGGKYYLLELADARSRIMELGELRPRGRDESFFLIHPEHLLEEEEEEVTLGSSIKVAERPRERIMEVGYESDAEPFRELGATLGLAKTFYNPQASRIIKEIPEEFTKITLDRKRKMIVLSGDN